MPLSWPPPEPPSDVGPRRAALEERRKRRRQHNTIGGTVLVVVAVVVAAIAAASLTGNGDIGDSLPTTDDAGGVDDRITTTLLFGTRETNRPTSEAVWLALLTVDPREDRGSFVYIPAHTAVEVPGRGLQGVGDAHATGGVPLLLVSVENMLGVQIDRYAELSDGDARLLFEATGPITVDVPSEVRVPAGRDRARLIFTPGLQELSSEFMVRLLYTVGVDGDDQELGARHLAFWDALFKHFEDDPVALGRAVEKAGPALSESGTSPEDHGVFFRALAELSGQDRTLTTMPVTQVSVGGDELYQTDEDELVAFVETTLGPHAGPSQSIRVQILNGNGEPGIGLEVAQRLVGHGFRVILSGNARRLDYENTLIVTYDSSEAGQEVAEQARELLGVGRVQVSAQDQGIVDLTIVVGEDFLETS